MTGALNARFRLNNDQPLDRALIIGGGNIGFRLAKSLEGNSIYCKIIEISPDRCTEIAEGLNKTVVLCGGVYHTQCPRISGPLCGTVCLKRGVAGRSGCRFYDFFFSRCGHHRKHWARIRHGRTGGKLCSDTFSR